MVTVTFVHDDFEDGTTSGWSPLNPTLTNVENTTDAPFAGLRSLRIARISTVTQRMVKTLTGLVIGREYTMRVAHYRPPTGTLSSFVFGIDGIGTIAPAQPSAGAWRDDAEYTFTATATEHVVIFGMGALGTGAYAQIDEFRVEYEGEEPDPTGLAFVGVPTTYADGTGASATATLPRPAGLQDGDYLVAMLRNQANESPDFTPPPGWQRVGTAYTTPAASRKHSTFIHRVPSAASEPGSYAFGVNQTGANRTVGLLAILRPSSPENTVAESGNSGVYGGSVVGGVRVAPGYALDPVPGVGLAIGTAEFTAGNDHVPITTPPGWDQLGIIASSAGVTGSRTALVAYSRAYVASPMENVPIGWTVASAPSVESVYFTEESDPEPPGPPPGFSSVDQLLATPGATWAHRGGSRDWPEMSAYAYEQSALAGYGALEFSAQRTSDGWWFGLHDNSLDRTSGVSGGGPINALTRAQVESYQITLNDNGTPRPYLGLIEFLDKWTPTHVVIVDPKNALGHNEEFLDILDAHGGPSRIVWKWFGVGANVGAAALAAAARGYRTWGYFYEEDVANGNLALYQGNFSILGMAIGAGLPAWEAVTSYGKPVTGHIAQTQENYDTAITKGARMVQVSGVSAVRAVSAPDFTMQWSVGPALFSGTAPAIPVAAGSFSTSWAAGPAVFTGAAPAVPGAEGDFAASWSAGPASFSGEAPEIPGASGAFESSWTTGPASFVGTAPAIPGAGGDFTAAWSVGPSRFSGSAPAIPGAAGAFGSSWSVGPATFTGSAPAIPGAGGDFAAGWSVGPTGFTGNAPEAPGASGDFSIAWGAGPATFTGAAEHGGDFGATWHIGPAIFSGSGEDRCWPAMILEPLGVGVTLDPEGPDWPYMQLEPLGPTMILVEDGCRP